VIESIKKHLVCGVKEIVMGFVMAGKKEITFMGFSRVLIMPHSRHRSTIRRATQILQPPE